MAEVCGLMSTSKTCRASNIGLCFVHVVVCCSVLQWVCGSMSTSRTCTVSDTWGPSAALWRLSFGCCYKSDSTRASLVSVKEPCISAKKNIFEKELYVTTKGPCFSAQEPYLFSKGPYLSSKDLKESHLFTKEPYKGAHRPLPPPSPHELWDGNN